MAIYSSCFFMVTSKSFTGVMLWDREGQLELKRQCARRLKALEG